MIRAENMQAEHLIDPIGVDFTRPRLSWTAEGAQRQTAFEIEAECRGTAVWSTGKVPGERMHAVYAGAALQSRMMIAWKVRLWDEKDMPGEWSPAATFEMGLLRPGDWKAKWIRANLRVNRKKRYPADNFRKIFDVAGPVAFARLYITACGLYEAEINGRKAGRAVLTPGYTDYRRRIQYQTYDVTDHLKAGANTLDVALGDGWYRGSLGAFSHRNVFGTQTKLLCQLEIRYADGSEACVASDETFAWCNDGPIRFSDMKDGETADAGRLPSYRGQAAPARCPVIPSSSNNVSVTEHERFAARLITTPAGKTVLDFTQNIAGFVAFSVRGPKGHRLTLRMGEALDNGEFTQANFQCRGGPPIEQKVEFVCSGGLDHYRTKFSLFGYRYALVENWPGEPDPSAFEAVAVYSDMRETGRFSCSNELVNRLVENARWSMKGNFADVPTDCPTREMAPWTGDAQLFCKTANYLMDASAFYRKYLKDIADRQTRGGKVHCIVPTVGNEGYVGPMDGSAGWADAVVLIPWTCWKLYGDESFIRDNYASMRAYALFCIRRAKHTFITRFFRRNPYRKYTYDCFQHFGEWLEPPGVMPGNFILNMALPKPEEATAYLHLTMRCMAEIAGALGKRGDEALFADYAQGSKKAYNYLFVKRGRIDTARQAKLVRPLALGLLDGDAKRNVQLRLDRALTQNNFRISTGFLSTPFLLPALVEAGFADTAFKTLENRELPGWLWQVEHGATTVCENWMNTAPDGKPLASQNHYAFGAVCQWLFEAVAGIEVAGENRFSVKPLPGGSINWAGASYDSAYGRIGTKWEAACGKFRLDVMLPCNTTASVTLPDGTLHEASPGLNHYECAMERNQTP